MTEEIKFRIAVEGAGQSSSSVDQVTVSLNNASSAGKRVADSLRAAGTVSQQSFNGMQVSAAQTAAAMRMVPAQMTDIVTSLASGQAPITVLLQQGGQLKDMFGGVGAATRALGSYIGGLITPVNAAVAGAAAMAAAYYQGSQEATALSRSIILTGNAAGTTVSQLQETAKAVADVTGATKSLATDALQQLVGTAQVASKNLGLTAEAAVRMEKAAGKPIADTVKEFAELGRAPVEASSKLNEQTRYLTSSVIDQIKALADQGKGTEAAALAQKAWADASISRSKEITENLGFLEKAWKKVKEEAIGAWDSMAGVGRKELESDKLDRLKNTIALKQSGLSRLTPGSRAYDVTKNELDLLLAQKAAIDQKNAANEKKAKDEGEAARKSAAHDAWVKENDKYLTREKQLENQITKIREEGAAAGASEAEINRRVAAVSRGEYLQVMDARLSKIREVMSTQVTLTEDAVKRGEMSELAGIEAIKAARIKAAQDEVAILAKKYGTAQSGGERSKISGEMDKASAEATRAISQADVQIKELEEKHDEALRRFSAAATETLTPIQQAWLKFWNENQKVVEEAQRNGWNDVIGSMSSAWATVAQNTNFTEAKREFEAALSEMQLRIETVREAAERDGGLFAGIKADAQVEEIRAKAIPALNDLIAKMKEAQGQSPTNEKAVTDAERAIVRADKQADEENRRRSQGVEQSIRDGLMRGFEGGKSAAENFRDTLKNMFRTLVLEPTIKPIAQEGAKAVSGLGSIFGNWLSGAFGGTSQSASEQAVGADINSAGMGEFADGGHVRGPGGPTDDRIPAWLSNGEYVVKSAAVAKVGVGFLNAINRGVNLPKFATGGYVGNSPAIASPASSAPANSPASVSVTQHIAVDARGADAGVEQKIMVAMARAKDAAVAEINMSLARGGRTAKLARGV